jgi:hypothetical protein
MTQIELPTIDTPYSIPATEDMSPTVEPGSLCHDLSALSAILAAELDEWVKLLDEFIAPASTLQIPAMPLITEVPSARTHRSKLDVLSFPFPLAVTKMISKGEAKQIPAAVEAMRKEFARLSGKCWIEADRRSKQDVIREAKLKGEEEQLSRVHWIIGKKSLSSQWEIHAGSAREGQCYLEIVYSIKTTRQPLLLT